jgi:hypothetical protein
VGFRLNENTAVLEFPESSVLHGATVRVSLDLPIRDLLAIQRDAERMRTADGPEGWDVMEESYTKFARDVLRDWDLEDRSTGEPLPCNEEGYMTLSGPEAQAIREGWMQAVTTVSGNLQAASENGAMSEAAVAGV